MAENLNGWNEYQRLVLNELNRHNVLIEDIKRDMDNRFNKFERQIYEKMSNVEKEIIGLKIKSGVWGIVGGLIITVPVLIAIMTLFLKMTGRG